MSSLVIGTAGHIDHGKSALVEALTGTHPDRLQEEKARGITIDLGFAHVRLADVTVGFVDVPGHERFIRNMLAGAGAIDAVMLVVAADESVMPQTREHFHVCRMLGLERGLVALTKIDRVDPETAELVTLEIRDLVAGSFLEGAPIIPVSARTGVGLEMLRAALAALPDVAPPRARDGLVRLPIDRVFSARGFGTVVTGTLVSGHVHEGAELVVLPAGRAVRVRGVQVHGAPVGEARAPSRAAVNLGGIDVDDLTRGVTLATAGSLAVTRRLDVRLEALPGGLAIRHGARFVVHQGTSEGTARFVISATRAGGDDAWQLLPPGAAGAVVPDGGEAYGRLRLEQPMSVTRGDRLVLRSITPPATVGGGIILDPEPPAGALRRPATLERFQRLDDAAPGEVLAVWLAEAGTRGLTAADLIRRGGADAHSAAGAIALRVARGEAIVAGERSFHIAVVRDVESRIAAVLAAFHRDHPADRGFPREALRDAAAPHGSGDLFGAVMDRLCAARVIRGTDRIALTTHDPSRSEEDMRARDRIEALVRDARLAPPDPTALQQSSGVAPAAFEQHIRDLVREGRLARLGTMLFHAEGLAQLRADLEVTRRAAPSGAEMWLDVAAFKTRFGLSRKYAIPLLEWLDRERVTRRVGDRRLVL